MSRDILPTDLLPDCNCPIQATASASSLSVEQLKTCLSGLSVDGFVNIVSSMNIMYVKVTAETINPVVQWSVVIDQNFQGHVHAFGLELGVLHSFWQTLPPVFDTVCAVEQLLNSVCKLKRCAAVTGTKLIDLLPVNRCLTDTHGNIEARRHSNCPANMPDNVRAVNCNIVIDVGLRCSACSAVQKRLHTKFRRTLTAVSTATDLMKSKTKNVCLRSPLKLKKLKQLAGRHSTDRKQILHLQSKICLYEAKCRKLIDDYGELLSGADNDSLLQLVKECKNDVTSAFPHGSFQQILFEQQLQYNTLANKASMRWHPAIIRWCLLIKSKSSAAYDNIRSFINLPCSRTLYDFTHYMESGFGINPKVLEQLIVKATKIGCLTEEHKSYVGHLFDEIKVRADQSSEFRLCPKLTRAHIELTSFSKIKVSLAAQTLSSSVANGLEMMYGDTVQRTQIS